MKTRISTGILLIIFFCFLSMYSLVQDYRPTPTIPAGRGQRHMMPKTFTKPNDAIVSDTLKSDSTVRHPEQSVKKLDFNMYRRSMYMHRKPFVV